jgi:ABC-type antimicrobial peptide transport system permease subunit
MIRSNWSTGASCRASPTGRATPATAIHEDRLIARLSILFGGLSVLLLATGLYGTLAYSVSRRTSEIGIRMALGAQRHEVLWMILSVSSRVRFP